MRRVAVDFEEAPLSDVLLFLADLTGWTFDASGLGDLEEREVTLRVRDICFGDALQLILAPRGLDLEPAEREKTVRVVAR
jgi:hypothetical protein